MKSVLEDKISLGCCAEKTRIKIAIIPLVIMASLSAVKFNLLSSKAA